MKKRNLLAIVTLMVISLAACTKNDVDKGAHVVYEEDFNGSSTWYKGVTDNATFSESEGKYIIAANQSPGKYVTVSSDIFKSTEKKQIVEYHLRVTGPGSAILIFNEKDVNNHSAVYIAENGKYYVYNVSQGTFTKVQNWTAHSNIKAAQQNVIRFELENNVLSMFSNGVKFYTWNNPGFSTLNAIGLGVRMWDGDTPTTAEIDKIRALVVD